MDQAIFLTIPLSGLMTPLFVMVMLWGIALMAVTPVMPKENQWFFFGLIFFGLCYVGAVFGLYSESFGLEFRIFCLRSLFVFAVLTNWFGVRMVIEFLGEHGPRERLILRFLSGASLVVIAFSVLGYVGVGIIDPRPESLKLEYGFGRTFFAGLIIGSFLYSICYLLLVRGFFLAEDRFFKYQSAQLLKYLGLGFLMLCITNIIFPIVLETSRFAFLAGLGLLVIFSGLWLVLAKGRIGFLTQEFEKLFKQLLRATSENFQSLRYFHWVSENSFLRPDQGPFSREAKVLFPGKSGKKVENTVTFSSGRRGDVVAPSDGKLLEGYGLAGKKLLRRANRLEIAIEVIQNFLREEGIQPPEKLFRYAGRRYLESNDPFDILAGEYAQEAILPEPLIRKDLENCLADEEIGELIQSDLIRPVRVEGEKRFEFTSSGLRELSNRIADELDFSRSVQEYVKNERLAIAREVSPPAEEISRFFSTGQSLKSQLDRKLNIPFYNVTLEKVIQEDPIGHALEYENISTYSRARISYIEGSLAITAEDENEEYFSAQETGIPTINNDILEFFLFKEASPGSYSRYRVTAKFSNGEEEEQAG